MAFERLAEEMIQRAIERGELKNLSGKGKPLDLELYFQAPAETRVLQKLLQDAGFVPREIELLQAIRALQTRLSATEDAGIRQGLRNQIARLRLDLDIRTEALRRDSRRK